MTRESFKREDARDMGSNPIRSARVGSLMVERKRF
jgi:hypothetical protein